jgi:tRNA(fMet)-specific endonuclease VapC
VPGSFLLDTNILIALFAKDRSVEERLAEAGEVFLSSIALGELYYGALRSTHVETNAARLDELASRITVLACDSATARQHGLIKYQLGLRGKPIPENDIWVAALARQYSLTLVSREVHFETIEALALEKW